MASDLLEKVRQLRFDRMRQGQNGAEIVEPPSFKGEIRFALIPLTELEYDRCLQEGSFVEAGNNPAGFMLRDRTINAALLAASIRNPDDLDERVFANAEEIQSHLGPEDLNFLLDTYQEMVDKSSPYIDGFSEAEVEEAKKALQQIRWSELYGRQWFALKRFLSTITVEQLGGSWDGFGSIRLLMQKRGPIESTPTVEPNTTPTTARFATNHSSEKE